MSEPTLDFNLAFVLVLAVIAFASAVKATLGFGFPLISVPIAANLIGARTAVVLIAVPVVFNNLLVLFRGGGTVDQFRGLAGLLGGVVAGTVFGAQLLNRLDPRMLSIIVGVISLVFAVSASSERIPAVSPQAQRYAGPLIGIVSGIIGGTTGIFAPLIAAYVHSLRLDKRAFVFWLTAAFLLGGLVQTASYYTLGLYSPRLLGYAVVTFIPVTAGTWLGFWIQDRLPADLFRRLVLLLVFVSGLNLVIRQFV